MSKADAWFPFYVGEYLADTAHLTIEQSGAYLHLLMSHWRVGCVPDDDAKLAAICRVTKTRWLRDIGPAVRPFFVTGDGKLQSRVIGKWEHATFGRLPWAEWQALRVEVFQRDGRICAYCDTVDGPWDIDHILPLARGGTNQLHNLTVACSSCNRSKRDLTLAEWRQ